MLRARQIAAVGLALALPFTSTHTANAAEAPVHTTAKERQLLEAPKDQRLAPQAEDVEQALKLIDSIPDEVLQKGDKATQQWIAEHQATATRASVAGCTAAIALFIGTNAVSLGKIVKIKRLIKDLGGLKEAVQIMWGASFSYEKMQAAGGTLAALAGEFFGVTSIRNECFQ